MRHFANFYVNLQENAEDALRGLVDRYPNSEVGYASTNYLDDYNTEFFTERMNLPNKEAVSTTLPLDKIGLDKIRGYPRNWSGLLGLQQAHTHPMILSAKAVGAVGKDVDISNVPKYPSLQDYIADGNIRNKLSSVTKENTINPALVITKEYGEPVTYKYKNNSDTVGGNLYSRLNAVQDAFRLGNTDTELFQKDEMTGKTRLVDDVSKPFLKRAALQEQISNSNDWFHKPFLSVERQAAHPIPVELPKVGQSRLGETVAAANAVGLAHGGYTLKKRYDENRKLKQVEQQIAQQNNTVQ